ncbi:MAG: GNAT family N-acetyltransferase [Luminiphilus sp.]|nr:GNAT family N-acetyltransferase [Luminiphilus sp.]
MQIFEIGIDSLSELVGFYDDTDGPSFEALCQLLKKPHTRAFGVKIHGKAVGVLWLLLSDDAVEIIDIRVVKAHRRRGIASFLLEAVAPNLVTQDRTDIFLDVRETNGAAIALYEGLGFSLESRRRGYYRGVKGREDALVMRKSLKLSAIDPS